MNQHILFLGKTLILICAGIVSLPIYSHCEPDSCDSGGVHFESPHHTLIHLHSNEKPRINCDTELVDLKTSKKSRDKEKEIQRKISELENIKECKVLDPFIKKLKERLERNHDKYLRAYERLRRMKKDSDKSIQVDHPVLANGSLVCTADKVSIDSNAYWTFFNDLHWIKSGEPLYKAQDTGDEIKNCYNVSVEGDGDLKGFYVKTNMAMDRKVFLRFEAFHEADQVVVFSEKNKVLYEGKCKEGLSDLEIKLPPKEQNSKIRIDVNHNCKPVEDSSKWKISVECLKKDIPCSNGIAELKQLLRDYLSFTPKNLDNVWIQIACYEGLYQDLIDTFMDGHHFFYDQGHKVCTKRSDCKQENLSLEDGAKSLKIKSNTQPTFKGRIPSSRSNKAFVYGRGTKHCLKSVNRNTSLFKIISRRYCLVAHERLFK